MRDQKATCVLQLSVTGQRHMEKNIICEDSCLCIEKNFFQFYGLADGQSGKQFCRIGGQEVLDAVSSYIETKGIQILSQYKYKDEIKYELIHIIRDTVSRMCLEYNAAEEQFASTVVAAAVDPETGIYMTVHLGDGGMIGLKKDNDVSFISSPENGITACYTWLTTSPDALLHLRIGFGRMEEYKKILLFTDGANAVCYGKNIMPEVKTLLSGHIVPEDTMQYLQDSKPEDDASIIIF